MAKRKPKYDPEAARAQERAQEHANWLDLVREDLTTTNLHTPAFTTPATCPCGCGRQAVDVAREDATFEAECQRADDWEYRGVPECTPDDPCARFPECRHDGGSY